MQPFCKEVFMIGIHWKKFHCIGQFRSSFRRNLRCAQVLCATCFCKVQTKAVTTIEFRKVWRHGETESRRNFVTALKVNAEWLGNALVRCTYFWLPLTTQHAQPRTKSLVQQMLTRRHDYSSRKNCHADVLYVQKKDKLSASLWLNFNAV